MVYKFLDKKTSDSDIKNGRRMWKNYTNQLSETLIKEKYIHCLHIIFAVQI